MNRFHKIDHAFMEPSVGIYQPFYKPTLVERLDGRFIPLDWLASPAPALRELALHRHIAERKLFTPELRGLAPRRSFPHPPNVSGGK